MNLGMCLACGKEVALVASERPDTCDVTFRATCHGSKTSITLDDMVFRMARSSSEALRTNKRFASWAMDLFPFENLPDIRELLAYNRGATKVPGFPNEHAKGAQ